MHAVTRVVRRYLLRSAGLDEGGEAPPSSALVHKTKQFITKLREAIAHWMEKVAPGTPDYVSLKILGRAVDRYARMAPPNTSLEKEVQFQVLLATVQLGHLELDHREITLIAKRLNESFDQIGMI